jgi:hypothetical protein
MIILLSWIGFSVALAMYAKRLNRSPPGWLLVGLLISPLLGWAFLAAMGARAAPPAPAPLNAEEERQETASFLRFLVCFCALFGLMLYGISLLIG